MKPVRGFAPRINSSSSLLTVLILRGRALLAADDCGPYFGFNLWCESLWALSVADDEDISRWLEDRWNAELKIQCV